MMDEDQTPIPESFIALYLPRGRSRPTAPRRQIAARYDLCEDMAQMLTEHARTTLFALSITEQLVLERIHQGLLAGEERGVRHEVGLAGGERPERRPRQTAVEHGRSRRTATGSRKRRRISLPSGKCRRRS